MNKKYDFLKRRKGWFSLSLDGKTTRIVIMCGYNSDTFNVLGEDRLLKGEALECYNKWRQV